MFKEPHDLSVLLFLTFVQQDLQSMCNKLADSMERRAAVEDLHAGPCNKTVELDLVIFYGKPGVDVRASRAGH